MKDFSLEAEERNGYLVSSEMKKVWAVQLDLVTKLLEVCKKHQLRIFAAGGTMLGTVRDHGYIPWDDDIDMMMPRKDYMKLIEIGEQEFRHPYFLQSGYNDAGYPHLHAQLRNSLTSAIRIRDIFSNFNQGIFIDIFIIDVIPENKECYETLFNARSSVEKKLLYYASRHWLYKNPMRQLAYINSVYYIWRQTFLKSYSMADNIFLRYRNSESNIIACMGVTLYPIESMFRRREWYENVVYLPFENIMMPVPAMYHEILSARYGDYMKPAKAPSIHGTVIFDTERPYTEVIKELRAVQPWYRKLLKAPDTNRKYSV